MCKREVQRCQSQPVSSDCMFGLVPVFFCSMLILAVSRQESSNCHERDGETPHLPVRAQTHIFLVRTSQCTIHIDPHFSNVVTSALAQGQQESVSHTSQTHCHVLVEYAFRPLPSCRLISYLFSVTPVSVIDIIGEDQIKFLFLCSLEWNVWPIW